MKQVDFQQLQRKTSQVRRSWVILVVLAVLTAVIIHIPFLIFRNGMEVILAAQLHFQFLIFLPPISLIVYNFVLTKNYSKPNVILQIGLVYFLSLSLVIYGFMSYQVRTLAFKHEVPNIKEIEATLSNLSVSEVQIGRLYPDISDSTLMGRVVVFDGEVEIVAPYFSIYKPEVELLGHNFTQHLGNYSILETMKIQDKVTQIPFSMSITEYDLLYPTTQLSDDQMITLTVLAPDTVAETSMTGWVECEQRCAIIEIDLPTGYTVGQLRDMMHQFQLHDLEMSYPEYIEYWPSDMIELTKKNNASIEVNKSFAHIDYVRNSTDSRSGKIQSKYNPEEYLQTIFFNRTGAYVIIASGEQFSDEFTCPTQLEAAYYDVNNITVISCDGSNGDNEVVVYE